ncbi:MAG: rod shape-determining protein RodA [Acidimicrobiia bacterium]|nr:rod shape-determining protein RodA [Acidimicrobiia bacterium]MDH3470977.1 rod shape-determining protein RodA [Acidimicrobiia bacterium]
MDLSARAPLSLDRDLHSRPDALLIIPVLALSALGALMIFSASAPRLEELGISPTSSLERQLVFMVLGALAFIAISGMSERSLRGAAPYVFVFVLVMLAAVFVIGDIRAGAQRWIALGSFQIQPSELAKPAVILALAAVLAPTEEDDLTWARILRAVALAAVPMLLIVTQPDLGTGLVMAFVAVVMLFVAGIPLRRFLALAVAGTVGMAAALQLGLFQFQQYQLDRLTAFLDQGSDLATVNYNLFQSRLTIGSGGLFGKGLFEGTQTNLSFVPSQSTDFIFTAVGEQLGFIGGAIVIFLYAFIVWRLLAIAASANDRFGRLAVSGVAALIAFHAIINVGMTLGIMPVTGLPLPFMSQGGSAYLAMGISLAIAHVVALHRSPVPGERRLL